MLALSYSLLGLASGPLVVLTACSITRCEPVSWPWGSWPAKTTSLAASLFLGSSLTYVALVAPRPAEPMAWLLIVGTVLALVDWIRHLLPHKVVGALFFGGLVLISAEALSQRDFAPLLRAGVASVVVFMAGLALYQRFAAELGFGDVTLTAALALYLGWCGWMCVVLGLAVGLLLVWIVMRMLLVAKRVGRHDPVALGPALLSGAVYVMLQA
ncbi:prepilin peptidase [Lentzea sp. NPDC034063]|uniref:prepilin peptidase n=1 Tax=unclassified Lentzea TaxID=2643253 RepID=UPI0033E6A562